MVGGQTELAEGGTVGPELVGGDLGGCETVFLQQLTYQLAGCGLIARNCSRGWRNGLHALAGYESTLGWKSRRATA